MTSSTESRSSRLLGRGARFGVATAALTGLVLAGAGVASAATDRLVQSEDIGTSYAAAGEVVWVEEATGATGEIATDTFDGRSALKMDHPDTSAKYTLFRSFGAGVRPTNIPDLLSDASYSFTGSNVNFQMAMFYTPSDPAQYGPEGTVGTCVQAKDNGVPLDGMCYTVIKYEPGAVTGDEEYETVELGNKQAALSDAGGGWWKTQRIGEYPKGERAATLDQLLEQMASYQVYAVGASVGSGTTGTAWLLDLTFNDDSFGFGRAPAEASELPKPPAADDTAALETDITAKNIDVAADTAAFVPGTGTALGGIDASKPFSGEFQAWKDPTDAFVDVYSFSSRVFVGTFPVVNGSVVMTGADLTHLAPGNHYLVFQGQTSRALGVVEIAVQAAAPGVLPGAQLANTGATTDVIPALVIGGSLLLAGAATVLVSRRLRSRRG